jgi:hypothetical protein
VRPSQSTLPQNCGLVECHRGGFRIHLRSVTTRENHARLFRGLRSEDGVEKDSEDMPDTFIGQRFAVNQRFEQKCVR